MPIRLRLDQSYRYMLALGGALAISAAGIAAYAAYHINRPYRRTDGASALSPWELGIEYEDLAFTSADGVTLRGWWLLRPETQNVIVVLAGSHCAKHEYLGIGSSLWHAGYNVLLFDFRGRGDSDRVGLSLGYYEQQDAQAALRYVRDRLPEARIGLLGYSMGAAVALVTAGKDPAVQAVVADSPFATLRDVVADAFRCRHLPPQLLTKLTDRLNRWRYGYDFSAVEPLAVVDRIAPRPLLLIHSSADSVIPSDHARRLFAAAGQPKQLWTIEQAPHCGAYFADRRAYAARIAELFAAALPLEQSADLGRALTMTSIQQGSW
jgi:uncharacterized protein